MILFRSQVWLGPIQIMLNIVTIIQVIHISGRTEA
jgi:hypothetical protein